MKRSVTKYPFSPKVRNPEAREVHTPKYGLSVIPEKAKKMFRKRKHKGLVDEKD